MSLPPAQAVKEHVVLEQVNEVCLQFTDAQPDSTTQLVFLFYADNLNDMHSWCSALPAEEEQLKELGNQIEEALTSGGDAMAAASLFHKADACSCLLLFI